MDRRRGRYWLPSVAAIKGNLYLITRLILQTPLRSTLGKQEELRVFFDVISKYEGEARLV